jgi:chromosome segregation protein
VQRAQFDAEKKVAVADTSIQNLQRTIWHLEEDRANREEQIGQLQVNKAAKEEQLSARQTDLEQLQAHHNNTKEQILKTQGVLEGLRASLAVENRKLDSKKNEHDLLKSLIDSMEGYPDSIKFLHNNRGWNHNAPILSDIIYVKEEYRAAVENVLEPYLNYYVVNNLAEGLQAVHLLDNAKKGKANFFLLDKVAGGEAQNHQPAGTTPAMEVIEVDALYRPLAEQLLGNVFIAEDEDVLERSNGAVILEKHGKYVKGKYTLSGGSVGLFEGKKIGRAKNLAKLHDEIVAQKEVVAELTSQIQVRHNEVIAYNADLKEGVIRQTEREIQQISNELYGLQNKMENLQHSQATSQNRMEELNEQLENTNTSVQAVRNELNELNASLADFVEGLQKAEEEYRAIEIEYNGLSTQYNTLNLQVTREQSKITGLKQELQFKSNQLNELRSQVELNTSQLKLTTEDIVVSEESLQGAGRRVVWPDAPAGERGRRPQ